MGRVSRSAIQARKNCEMKRFLTYHWKGTGMVPSSTVGSLEAIRGTAAHMVMEHSWKGLPWEEELGEMFKKIPEKVRDPQMVLIRRAMKGWYKKRWPLLSSEWDIVSAEGAWNWLLSPDVMEPIRMDRLMRAKDTGHLGIFDFKFIGSMDLNWRERHSHSDQTHLYVQALKERSGEPVDGIIYDAIIVGKWDVKNEIQKSPFVSAYDRGPSYGPILSGRYSPTWVKGTALVSILDWPDSTWLQWAQETEILNELYCTSGLINPPSEDLLRTKASTIYGEREWDKKLSILEEVGQRYGYDSHEYTSLFDSTVERNPDSCLQYGWEKKCEHYTQCWIGGHPDDYVPREDHHPRT